MQRKVLLALYYCIPVTFHIKERLKNSLEGVRKVQKTLFVVRPILESNKTINRLLSW